MSSVHPSRIVGSATFRLALGYAGLFIAFAALLFAGVYRAMIHFEDQQIRKSISTEARSLTATGRNGPADSLSQLIDAKSKSPGQQRFRYGLVEKNGSVTGDLETIPADIGWRTQELLDLDSASEGFEHHALLYVFGTELSDGRRLFVAQDDQPLEELRESIGSQFAIAASFTAALAILGGLAVSILFLRRIEQINQTAHRIIDGDIGERIPVAGSNDEFDRLAGNLNSMLDRIAALMGSMRQVTGDIAHDLRTPLAHLRQDLETTRGLPRSSADYEAAIDRSIVNTDGILKMFGALLRISEISSGERKAGFKRLDFSALCVRVAEIYGAVAEEDGRTLAANVAPGLLVQGDEILLTQMLVNLTENALRHTPPGARIAISLESRGKSGVVCVSDDGPGIPQNERDAVLRPFYRLDRSRSTPGSGLGLALVASIADLHCASFTISDNAPGTRATLHFPQAN